MKRTTQVTKKSNGGFWTAIAIAGGLIIGISFSMKPWKVYSEQRKATAQQVSITREAERQRAADEELDAHIGSSVGREELARKQGWHKPGEIPIATGP